jgi:hypothetical protein
VVGRVALALAVAAALAAIAHAQAQSLARLTVQSFGLSADTTKPKIDVPFHLILILRVRERVSQVANLDLPILAELELLGDERATTSAPRGTQYRETVTVVAHRAGAIAIGPATLAAVDARDGKPKQWYTNGLTLQVAGAGPQVLRSGAQLLRRAAVALVWLVAWVAGAGCVAIAAIWIFRRSRRTTPVTVVPAPPPAPLAVERSRRAQAEDALTVLRAERSRSAAVAVRAAIWRMAGASDGETLGDVLRRPDTSEETMRQLLIALERSAFTYDDDLAPAIDDTCFALERYIGAAA